MPFVYRQILTPWEGKKTPPYVVAFFQKTHLPLLPSLPLDITLQLEYRLRIKSEMNPVKHSPADSKLTQKESFTNFFSPHVLLRFSILKSEISWNGFYSFYYFCQASLMTLLGDKKYN